MNKEELASLIREWLKDRTHSAQGGVWDLQVDPDHDSEELADTIISMWSGSE